MDPNTLFTLGAALGGAMAGYLGGRNARTAQSEALSALIIRIDDQQKTIDTIPALKEEIRVLTGLVTQRAEVEKVIEIVERIEAKFDAQGR